MNCILVVALFAVGICLCHGASTTRRPRTTIGTTTHAHHGHSGMPHPSREPVEKETFTFMYSIHTHNMYVHAGPTCYIGTLSLDEQKAVHTDSGLRALELKFLQKLGTASQVTKESLDESDAHACGKRSTMFYMIQ